MRGDGGRQGVVLGFEALPNCLTARGAYGEWNSICLERDGFRNRTQSRGDESNCRSGRLQQRDRA
jgi:hypothetical protein